MSKWEKSFDKTKMQKWIQMDTPRWEFYRWRGYIVAYDRLEGYLAYVRKDGKVLLSADQGLTDYVEGMLRLSER